MAEQPALLYLEPDDEITSVVRRLRAADPGRVVLVASGRSKATTSAVALRLLAGVAAEEGREVALVADAAGRALAAEAGIPAFASVAEASAEGAVPAEPPAARRAPIRVVRGEEARVTVPPPAPPRVPSSLEETREVPLPQPAPQPRRPAPTRSRPPTRRGVPRAFLVALLITALLAAGAFAAVLPAATIDIAPTSQAIEPVRYTLELPVDGTDDGELQAEVQQRATGVHRDPTPASGGVTFANYNTSPVRVDAGTRVAAGDIVFGTTETVVVPTGFFTIPGTADAPIVALEPGPSGNLPTEAIDTVVDEDVRNALRAFSDNPNRLVANNQPTAGGDDNEEPEVTQQDVGRARRALRADLDRQLAGSLEDDPELVYAAAEADDPSIPVPDDLIGRRGEETFTLAGTMTYHRAHVALADVEAAASEQLLDDDAAAPEGREVVADTIGVAVEGATLDGDVLQVTVLVTAEAAPILDEAAVRDRVAGRTAAEAETALAAIGPAKVTLWPSWVDRVPQLPWRIELRVVAGPSSTGSPEGSGS